MKDFVLGVLIGAVEIFFENANSVTILLAVITVATKLIVQILLMHCVSQYCLQLSLLQLATDYYNCAVFPYKSQYCLQLSLLQQQGFKTLALSGFQRSFLPTKQIFRSFRHFSAFFYQHQMAKLPYHNGLRLIENLNCTFASHRTKTNI